MTANRLDLVIPRPAPQAHALLNRQPPILRNPVSGRPVRLDQHRGDFESPETASGAPSPAVAGLLKRQGSRAKINRIAHNQRQLMAAHALDDENILRMTEALLWAEDRLPAGATYPVSLTVVWNRFGTERSLEGAYKSPEAWTAAIARTAREIDAYGYLVISRAFRRDHIKNSDRHSLRRLLSFFTRNDAPAVNNSIPLDCFAVFAEDLAGQQVNRLYPIVPVTTSCRGIGFPLQVGDDQPSPFAGLLTGAPA